MSAHEFDISRATSAEQLDQCEAQLLADPDLTPEERTALIGKIRARFCQLNAEAVGAQKPRWGA